MEPLEPRHLITYPAAMRLSGWVRRAFYERLKEHGIVTYIDPNDRRRRWIDRRDVLMIRRPVERTAERAT